MQPKDSTAQPLTAEELADMRGWTNQLRDHELIDMRVDEVKRLLATLDAERARVGALERELRKGNIVSKGARDNLIIEDK